MFTKLKQYSCINAEVTCHNAREALSVMENVPAAFFKRQFQESRVFRHKNYIPILCRKGPNLQYSGLVLEHHTPQHYGAGIRYLNLESRDLMR